MEGVIHTILSLLSQHKGRRDYPELLRRLRLALDAESVRLWAESPLWCGQPKNTEARQ